MSNEQIAGIIRTLLAAGAGFIVARGWVDAVTAEAVVGGLVTILVATWSWWAKRPAKPPAIQ